MKNKKNKRKFPRLNEKWRLVYRVVEHEQFFTDPIHQYTLNISGGGISFMANEAMKTNTMVALELESDQIPAPVLALAKVVWCKKSWLHQGYEVGAEFWWVGWQNNDAQQAIAGYIASMTRYQDSLYFSTEFQQKTGQRIEQRIQSMPTAQRLSPLPPPDEEDSEWN